MEAKVKLEHTIDGGRIQRAYVIGLSTDGTTELHPSDGYIIAFDNEDALSRKVALDEIILQVENAKKSGAIGIVEMLKLLDAWEHCLGDESSSMLLVSMLRYWLDDNRIRPNTLVA